MAAPTAAPALLSLRAVAQQPQEPPWRITSEHLDPSLPQTRKLHLIVLNWHLPAITLRLWQRGASTTRICADGGANRLHDDIPTLAAAAAAAAGPAAAAAAGLRAAAPAAAAAAAAVDAARAAYLPDVIRGDLDSVRPDVAAYYASHGVAAVDLSADQESTDLGKCLAYLDAHIHGGGGGGGCSSSNADAGGGGGAAGSAVGEQEAQRLRAEHGIVVLGALGGRLDHTLAHLNALYEFPHLDITLCGDGNLVRLLPRGRCVITPAAGSEGPTCGLVPLAGPVVASTRGLRWNLDNTEMRFRGLISTSNIVDAPEVEVKAGDDLIWITEFEDGGHVGRPNSVPRDAGVGDSSASSGGGGGT